MSVYHHIRQLVVQEFFLTRSNFPGKWQTLIFFCFHSVTKTHQDKKSPLKYKSMCGRVVKPSGLNTDLSLCDSIITGSSLRRRTRFTHHFFSIILNKSVVFQRFIVDCYVSLYHTFPSHWFGVCFKISLWNRLKQCATLPRLKMGMTFSTCVLVFPLG